MHPLVSGDRQVFTPHRPPRPDKSEGGIAFKLVSEYEPKGDQPTAIAELVAGVNAQERNQVLLGVTGSGKTFTAAQVIAATQRPALVLAPNKTLAAQLYGEFKSFFPDNAVEYFVSYYDYYQPEAYVPRTDTYIEKESSVNEQIDRMRHAATRSLLERDDVIIVASVSCIYGIGSVETYTAMTFTVQTGETLSQRQLLADLVALHYRRSDANFIRGTFRVRGDTVELFPAHLEDRAWRISLFGDEVESITEFDPLTGAKTDELKLIKVYSNSHYVTPKPTLQQALKSIKAELKQRLDELYNAGRLLEAQRLEQRTLFDMEMMEATGSCAGIENYSRYLTGRQPGEPPPTLFEYLPDNALVFVDESHVTVPQIGGMFRGDYRRKATLAEYGFRLPSCMDNRPLRFEEWDIMRPQTMYVSATPGSWEIEQAGGVFVEQVIRPTGLIDPITEVRPAKTQVDDLIDEVRQVSRAGYRTLVTVLTKRMAEDLTEYMHEQGIRVRYMHSDIETLERIEIIRDLRLGAFDVLIGINLLREGLDIPECALVAILDADKEGFLQERDQSHPDHRPRRAQRRRPGDPLRRPDDRQPRAGHRRDRAPAREAEGLERGQRHHAGKHQAQHPRRDGQRLRAGPRRRRCRPRRDQRHAGRPQPQGRDRRPREEDARGRGRPRVRDRRAPARRGQAPARDRARRRRRSPRPPGRRRGARRRLRRHPQIRRRPAREGPLTPALSPRRASPSARWRTAPRRGGERGTIRRRASPQRPSPLRGEGQGEGHSLPHPARVPARAADLRPDHHHPRHACDEAIARRHGPRHRPRCSRARRGRRLAHSQTRARRDGLRPQPPHPRPRSLATPLPSGQRVGACPRHDAGRGRGWGELHARNRISTRAPKPAPTASRSRARTSRPSTKWAPTPSAASPSRASRNPCHARRPVPLPVMPKACNPKRAGRG